MECRSNIQDLIGWREITRITANFTYGLQFYNWLNRAILLGARKEPMDVDGC